MHYTNSKSDYSVLAHTKNICMYLSKASGMEDAECQPLLDSKLLQ